MPVPYPARAAPPTARCRAPPRCCCAPGSPRYNGGAPSPIPPRRVAADGEDRKPCEPHGSIAEACLRGVEGPAARPPQRFLDAAGDQGRRDEVLASTVVQIARDPPPLLVLRPHQRGREPPRGALGGSQLVDQRA